ncbi:hypothetical protein TKK_0019649 [Trichogramma kaykai]
MTIVKLFTKYGLFEKSSNLEESWYESTWFTSKAKNMKIIPDNDLSLYDLIQLRPKEAEKRLMSKDLYHICVAAASQSTE